MSTVYRSGLIDNKLGCRLIGPGFVEAAQQLVTCEQDRYLLLVVISHRRPRINRSVQELVHDHGISITFLLT